MSQEIIWEGSSTFTSGSTPFGFYDNDLNFQIDADKVAKFCTQRLGFPLTDVELDSGSLYACFEEAVTTYGNEVWQYKIRENYISLEGSTTGSSISGKVIQSSLAQVIKIARNYGTEAGVGGNVTKYSGSIELIPNQQTYNMDLWAQNAGITGSIEIRRVFYEAPPAVLRYFDPYAGTGADMRSLLDSFDFGAYSPGISFMLMPAFFDVLKIQAIEFNDQIRKSAYSFEIVNNDLKIFPIPKSAGTLWFEYYKDLEKNNSVISDQTGVVSNVGEVPYTNPNYTAINSIGRQWIFRYTLALAKEILGYIRGKYQKMPIPNSETELNHKDLLKDAREEKAALLSNLREMLDQTSRVSQLERKSNESKYLQDTLSAIPLTIYVG